jgi:hypothetical protein
LHHRANDGFLRVDVQVGSHRLTFHEVGKFHNGPSCCDVHGKDACTGPPEADACVKVDLIFDGKPHRSAAAVETISRSRRYQSRADHRRTDGMQIGGVN